MDIKTSTADTQPDIYGTSGQNVTSLQGAHPDDIREAPRSLWKTFSAITGNVLFALMLLVMAGLVFSMVQSRLSGNPPTVAGHQMYVVLSGSMNPAFDTGSLAFLKPLGPESIVTGDIITFRTSAGSDSLTTHRVVEVNRGGDGLSFTTRGDANEINDPFPVRGENVIGKITFAVPYAGYLMSFGQTRTGLVTLVFIPGILIIIFELRNLFRYAAEMEREKAVGDGHELAKDGVFHEHQSS